MAFTEKYVTVSGGGLHDGSSEANAWTISEANTNMSVGDRLNVKAGSYTMPSSFSAWPTGTSTSPCSMRGYKSTIGDLDNAQSSQLVDVTDMPYFATGSGKGSFRPLGSNNPWIIENISFFSDYFQQNPAWCDGSGQVWRKCKFVTSATGSYYDLIYRSITGNNHSRFENCLFSVPSNWTSLYGPVELNGCLFHGCVFENIYNLIPAGSTDFINCIFNGASGDLIKYGNYASTATVEGCTFYNINGDAIQNTTITGWNTWGGAVSLRNNVFHTISGNAVRGLSSTDYSFYLSGNLFYNVSGSNFANSTCDSERDSVTASSDPFTDTAGGDFSLTAGSGGQGKASPQLFMGFDQSNNQDIGAIQHADPSGGGGAVLHPLRSN